MKVTFDELGEPTSWRADWEMANSVDEFYGYVSPPLDPFGVREAELHLRMTKLFNPFGCYPKPLNLETALRVAESMRSKQYMEATELYIYDVEGGRRLSTSTPPSEWNEAYHVSVVECLLEELETDARLISREIGRDVSDAQPLRLGGLTDAEIESAIAIERELCD